MASKFLCPECWESIPSWKPGKDARCTECLHDKKVLPVNYRRYKQEVEED